MIYSGFAISQFISAAIFQFMSAATLSSCIFMIMKSKSGKPVHISQVIDLLILLQKFLTDHDSLVAYIPGTMQQFFS